MASEAGSRAFMAEAKELVEAGQFGKAIEVLQQGLKQFPKMVSARVMLGEVYWTSGDLALARVELEQVIKSAPDNFAAYRKLAQVYRDLGDTAAAIKACETILQANPKDREMGQLLEELQSHAPTQKAGTAKRKEAKKAPKEPEEKPEEEARAPHTTVRMSRSPVPERAPEDSEEETDSESLAELYVSQGHHDKGLEIYRRLVAKDPDNASLRARVKELEESGIEPGATLVLEKDGGGPSPPAPPKAPTETPAQAKRKARIRRLEGWLAVIRERRRT